MRYLIVTWYGGGNNTPNFGLAELLVQAGHRVRVLGPSELDDQARNAGAEFRSFPTAPHPAMATEVHEEILLDVAQFMFGAELAEDVLTDLADPVDAVLVDHGMAAALAAAEKSGLPTAAIVHNLYQPFVEGEPAQMFQLVLPLMNATRGHIGLDPLPEDCVLVAELGRRPDLLVACMPEVLDRPLAEPRPNLRYVGPIRATTRERWERPRPSSDRPLVLVSLSTTNMRQAPVLMRILEAVGALDVDVLCTLGGVALGDLHAPPNVTLADWIPHDAVLPHAATVVGHGGLSTVLGALQHGVPLVILPMGRDQPANAARVSDLGAGCQLGPESEPDAIRAAVADVLGDPSYRDAARAISRDIAAYGNGATALAELEALARAPAVRTEP